MNQPRPRIHLIIGMILIVLVPHLPRLPLWVMAWSLSFWSYAILIDRYKWSYPPKTILRGLTVVGFVGVLLTYRQGINQESCVTLLATMAGLKPLETHTFKDRMVTVFLTYFFVIANLNYSSSLAVVVYLFLSILITTTMLIHINHPQGRLLSQSGRSLRMMLQAMPLMLVVFFLFPRLPMSVLERHSKSAGVSGFTDRLNLGDITQLARSTEIAFRVEFEGPIPPRNQLYWRGVVFHYFDGVSWKTEPGQIDRTRSLDGEQPVNYSVMLEPHNSRRLFALELPATAPDSTRILREHILYADKSISRRYHYDVRSFLQNRREYLDHQDLKYMRLARKGNPATRALAQQWRASCDTTEALVARALQYFQENSFTYTLDPVPISGQMIDDFLFRTRSGYCEHFAASLAVLMHHADIPARVVGGYTGGVVNPYGNYLIVRQYHAHAWTEIWHENSGWIRVDPTLAIAPVPVEQRGPVDQSPYLVDLLGLTKYYLTASLGWDALNNQWNTWFYSYSFYRQKRLLSRLGLELDSWLDPLKLILLILVVTAIFILILVMFNIRKKASQQDALHAVYNRFCKKLTRLGYPRRPSQGPLDYASHISAVRPDLSEEVHEIINLYIHFRYGRGVLDSAALKSFKNRIKKIKLRK